MKDAVWGSVLFLNAVILSTMFSLYGVDLTDTGYYFFYQANMGNALASDLWMVFLSDLIGYAWLKLGPEGSLFWFKFGGAVVSGFVAMICYFILRQWYSCRTCAISTIVVLVALPSFVNLGINYYSFPAIVLMLIMLIYSKIFAGALKPRRYVGIALGVLYAFLVFSRISLVSFYLLSILYIILLERYSIIELRLNKKVVVWGVASWIVASAAFFYLYVNMGAEVLLPAQGGGDSHALSNLLAGYLGHIIKSSLVVCLFFLVRFALKRCGVNSTPRPLYYGFIICLTFGLCLFYLFHPVLFLNPARVMVYFVLPATIVGVFLVVNQDDKRRLYFYIFLLLACMQYVLGSNTGMAKIIYVAVPLMAFVVAQYISQCYKLQKYDRRLYATLGIVVLTVSVFVKYTYYYRDEIRLDTLTFGKVPQLSFIATQKKRLHVIEPAIEVLEQTIGSESYIVANSIPLMACFLTSNLALGDPWPFLLPIEILKDRLMALLQAGKMPKYIVMSKQNTSEDWPSNNPERTSKADQAKYAVMMEFISDNDYRISWQNDMFILYESDEKVGLK